MVKAKTKQQKSSSGLSCSLQMRLRLLLPVCRLSGSWFLHLYRRGFKFPQGMKALKQQSPASCPSASATRLHSPVFTVFGKTFLMNSSFLQCWFVVPNLGFGSANRGVCLHPGWWKNEDLVHKWYWALSLLLCSKLTKFSPLFMVLGIRGGRNKGWCNPEWLKKRNPLGQS